MIDFSAVAKEVLTSDQHLRVFVSSTINDLKDEREAVRRVVESLRLRPVLFETEGARPYPPRSVYSSALEQSHICVAIFWRSYGWIAPDMDISGLEDEYNLSSTKPRLIYIKRSEERDERLKQLIRRVQNEAETSYASFTNTDELAEMVANDIMHLLVERFRISMQYSQQPIILPSYLEGLRSEMQERGYIDRIDLLASVEEKLSREKRLFLVGDPGIGKTFLMGALGDRIESIYLSLKNRTTQQACAYLANHLSTKRHRIPQNLPTEEEARLTCYPKCDQAFCETSACQMVCA